MAYFVRELVSLTENTMILLNVLVCSRDELDMLIEVVCTCRFCFSCTFVHICTIFTNKYITQNYTKFVHRYDHPWQLWWPSVYKLLFPMWSPMSIVVTISLWIIFNGYNIFNSYKIMHFSLLWHPWQIQHLVCHPSAIGIYIIPQPTLNSFNRLLNRWWNF